MDEAGDPTPKYFAIRDLIKDYLPLPNITVPARAPKLKLPPLKMVSKTTLLSPIARQKLARTQIKSDSPFVTFEEIDQFSGFVLYETVLPKLKHDPSILEVPKIHDRAIVMIDDVSISSTLNENCNFSKNPLYSCTFQVCGWNIIERKSCTQNSVKRWLFGQNIANFT